MGKQVLKKEGLVRHRFSGVGVSVAFSYRLCVGDLC